MCLCAVCVCVLSVSVCCLYLCLGVTVSMEPLGLVHVRRVRRLLREELGQTAWNRDKPRVYLTLNAFK